MTIEEFADLVNDGVHPVVEFKKGIEDIEAYAEPGMRARAIGAVDDIDCIKIELDFSEFETFNQRFETSNYYDKESGTHCLTARQAGMYEVSDGYYLGKEADMDLFFEVVEDTSLKLYELYKGRSSTQCGDLSYVQWLEHFAARQIGI